MEGLPSLIFLALLIGIFYFMLIRPQKRRVDQHRKLVESLDIGDEVVTIGGIRGTVRSIGEEDIQVEVAPGTVLSFIKNAVARKVVPEDVDEVEATSEEEGG